MKRFELKIKEWEKEKEKLEKKRNLIDIKKRKLGELISNLSTKIGFYERKYRKS